jgi:hypothetical protein
MKEPDETRELSSQWRTPEALPAVSAISALAIPPIFGDAL